MPGREAGQQGHWSPEFRAACATQRDRLKITECVKKEVDRWGDRALAEPDLTLGLSPLEGQTEVLPATRGRHRRDRG